MEFKHIPIMLKQVTDGLNVKTGGIYVDCTVGGGGHSSEILRHGGKLFAFDKDADAIKASAKRLSEFGKVQIYDENFKLDLDTQAVLIKAEFKDAPNILKTLSVDKVDGVLIDLGVSSYQIDNAERGFSFLNDGKLDMRMDMDNPLSAYEVVNDYSEDKLREIFYKYGEEEFSKSIAANIIKYRKEKPIETTFELREIIENSMPKKIVYSRKGASKKVFQAIRIEVNGELDGLDKLIENFIDMLNVGGRFAILSFHSLEDRIVKNTFKLESTDCICPPHVPICVCHHKASVKLVNKKPIVASDEEQKLNSRSTSAKLRIVEKL